MTTKKKTPLNEKQKAFCREYLIDFSATKAATRAGYSKKTAGSQGHDLLKKPEIQSEIQKLADKRNDRVDNTIEKIILELQMIAFGDYKDLVEWDEHGIKKWIPSDQLDDKSRLVQEISETTTQHGGSRKIKLYDKMRALELLGKYHKIFTDKVEHSNPDGSMRPVVNINIPSNGREASE